MSRITTGSLALAFSLTVTVPLSAQPVGDAFPTAPAAATAPMNPVPLVVGGAVGSFVGLWAGLYGVFNFADGDGFLVLPAVLGASALGTAIGINLASDGAVSFSDAIGASLMGTLTGLGTALLVGSSGGADVGGVMIGYSIGQGALAGVVANLTRGSHGARVR